MELLFSLLGCIWIHGTGPDGQPKSYEPMPVGDRYVGNVAAHYGAVIDGDNSEWEKKVEELRGRTDPESRNDYAVALIYTGEYEAAIQVLSELEEQLNQSYFVATNLGTAYELSGDNEKALEWIHKGLMRNRESHGGTEWLHELILERKIASSDSVFPIADPVDFSTPPSFSHDGRTYTPREVLRAILYQTTERAAFVKPPDPLMANLFAMAGHLSGSTVTLEAAIEFFDLSLDYGYSQREVLEGAIWNAWETIESARRWSRVKIALIAGAHVLITILVAGLLVRRLFRKS